ncbi:unnamed protein product, partial [Scytosiphon promiscuus]
IRATAESQSVTPAPEDDPEPPRSRPARAKKAARSTSPVPDPTPPSSARRRRSIRRRSTAAARRAPTASSGHVIPEQQAAAACAFGTTFCSKTDLEWAAAQAQDPMAFNVIKYVSDPDTFAFPDMGDSIGDGKVITLGSIQALAGKCEIIKVPNKVAVGTKQPLELPLLIKKATTEPKDRPDRNSGKFERLLGDEPNRVYVPFLLRPWALDAVHKEGCHLGEAV